MAVGDAAFLVSILLAVAGLLAGVVGLVQGHNLPKPRPTGAAWLGIIVGLAALALTYVVPEMGRPSPTARIIKCGSNLRQIGQGLRQYAIDHPTHARYPPTFEVLFPESDLVPEVFICPSSRSQPGPPPFVVGENCDYRYFGLGLDYSLPAEVVLAACDPKHHHRNGASVLFNDGSVRFLTTSEMLDALAVSQAILAAQESGPPTSRRAAKHASEDEGG